MDRRAFPPPDDPRPLCVTLTDVSINAVDAPSSDRYKDTEHLLWKQELESITGVALGGKALAADSEADFAERPPHNDEPAVPKLSQDSPTRAEADRRLEVLVAARKGLVTEVSAEHHVTGGDSDFALDLPRSEDARRRSSFDLSLSATQSLGSTMDLWRGEPDTFDAARRLSELEDRCARMEAHIAEASGRHASSFVRLSQRLECCTRTSAASRLEVDAVMDRLRDLEHGLAATEAEARELLSKERQNRDDSVRRVHQALLGDVAHQIAELEKKIADRSERLIRDLFGSERGTVAAQDLQASPPSMSGKTPQPRAAASSDSAEMIAPVMGQSPGGVVRVRKHRSLSENSDRGLVQRAPGRTTTPPRRASLRGAVVVPAGTGEAGAAEDSEPAQPDALEQGGCEEQDPVQVIGRPTPPTHQRFIRQQGCLSEQFSSDRVPPERLPSSSHCSPAGSHVAERPVGASFVDKRDMARRDSQAAGPMRAHDAFVPPQRLSSSPVAELRMHTPAASISSMRQTLQAMRHGSAAASRDGGGMPSASSSDQLESRASRTPSLTPMAGHRVLSLDAHSLGTGPPSEPGSRGVARLLGTGTSARFNPGIASPRAPLLQRPRAPSDGVGSPRVG